MKLLIGAALSVALAFGASGAMAKSTAGSAKMKTCAAQWDAMKKAGQTKGQKYRDFTKSCMAGGATGPAPTPATVPTPSATPASTPMGDHHPVCKKGKVCGNSCIAMNKVCHK